MRYDSRKNYTQVQLNDLSRNTSGFKHVVTHVYTHSFFLKKLTHIICLAFLQFSLLIISMFTLTAPRPLPSKTDPQI